LEQKIVSPDTLILDSFWGPFLCLRFSAPQTQH
jgi:hypothetical protein